MYHHCLQPPTHTPHLRACDALSPLDKTCPHNLRLCWMFLSPRNNWKKALPDSRCSPAVQANSHGRSSKKADIFFPSLFHFPREAHSQTAALPYQRTAPHSCCHSYGTFQSSFFLSSPFSHSGAKSMPVCTKLLFLFQFANDA